MSKKLTLSIDDDLIVFAHSYAKQTGTSVSALFETYLHQLQTTKAGTNFDPQVTALYGLFRKSPVPDKYELRKLFNEKDSDRS